MREKILFSLISSPEKNRVFRMRPNMHLSQLLVSIPPPPATNDEVDELSTEELDALERGLATTFVARWCSRRHLSVAVPSFREAAEEAYDRLRAGFGLEVAS